MNSIVFQAMDDDYIEPFPLDDLLTKLKQIASEPRPAGEVYFFNIHLNRVASNAPYGFVAHKEDCGFFLSISEANEVAPLHEAFVVKVNDDVRPVSLVVGEHRLSVPSGVFLSIDDVTACVAHFCNTGSKHPNFTWMRFNDSWFAE